MYVLKTIYCPNFLWWKIFAFQFKEMAIEFQMMPFKEPLSDPSNCILPFLLKYLLSSEFSQYH